MVQQIEGLEAELKFEALGERGCCRGGEIETDVFRSTKDTSSGITEDFRWGGLGKRGQVPIVQDIVRATVGVLAGDNVAIVLLKVARKSGGIAGGQTRKRESGAHHIDPANLPT